MFAAEVKGICSRGSYVDDVMLDDEPLDNLAFILSIFMLGVRHTAHLKTSYMPDLDPTENDWRFPVDHIKNIACSGEDHLVHR